MLLAMDPELNNPDSDTNISFDPLPPGSFPLISDPDSRWHAHAGHDGHLHPSHNRPHVSSHTQHPRGGHHHGHHHHDNHSGGDNSQRRSHRVAGHQPRNPNYRLSRDELRIVAGRTLDAIDNGWYIPDGTDVPIDLGPKMEFTNAQTAYYAPDDEEIAAWATKDLGQEKKETKILIKEYSTLVGARKLHGMLTQAAGGDKAEAKAEPLQEDKSKGKEGAEEIIASDESEEVKDTKNGQPSSTETDKEKEGKANEGKENEGKEIEGEEDKGKENEGNENEGKKKEANEDVKETEQPNDPQPTSANHTIGVLNFASAKKPGGGFINGAQAQEESIARASTLYPSLVSPEGRKFYTHYHADPDNAFYTHAMVYSPAVVLFRGDMGDWKKPVDVDVLTSAAVNAGDVRESVRRDHEMHALRVRVREAELSRRAEIERKWEEREQRIKEHEEGKASEVEEKESRLVGDIETAEKVKSTEEIKAEEKTETDDTAVKDEVDQDKASSPNAAEEKEKPTEEIKFAKPVDEIIKSDAEKVEVDFVEPTNTQRATEEEDSTKVDVSKDDLTTPQPPPPGPSEPLEPSSSSSPANPPLETDPSSPPIPSRRPRPTFPALRDLPPPPTLTLEDAEVLIANTMYERIARLLFLFHQRGATHLVLGSFGTGVFQNSVRLVAEIFYLLLAKPGAPFEGKFDTVVFAILGGATVREFRDVFGEKAAPEGIDELDGEDSEIEGMKDEVVTVGGTGVADPRGEDGKADEPAQTQSAVGVPEEVKADEEKGMVVDRDVQTDEVMVVDEEAKVVDDAYEPQDVEMVSLTSPPTEAVSTSDPAPAPTTTTDAQTQT